MKKPMPKSAGYHAALTRWAKALATAREEAVFGVLAAGSSPDEVKMFVDGNLDKRLQLLLKHLAFVAGAFANFDKLVQAYVLDMPMKAFTSPSEDCERLLRWLKRKHKLKPQQKDYVTCQRARFAVEAAGKSRRRQHVHFQELRSVAGKLAGDLDLNPRLRIHLNPIRVWARFRTRALLDAAANPPADVLFFPIGPAITTAILEPSGQALVRELEEIGATTLAAWAARSRQANRAELAAFCRDLAEIGLVAFS